MLIRIDGVDLPGLVCPPQPDASPHYENVHVAVQGRRKDELLGRTRGDEPAATWTIECRPAETEAGIDLKGPHIQGPPSGRFIYLSWGTVDGNGNFEVFRRAKLWLDGAPAGVRADAVRLGVLVGRLGLTDRQGLPVCASVRPPLIAWSAEAAP